MKHIFVVNPQAGGRDSSREIEARLKGMEAETEMYVTRGPRDATAYVAGRCRTEAGPLRFYACGGDGTMNEVVSGLMEAGRTGVAAGILPCGSGNDYVKNWPGADFCSPQALVDAPTQAVDVMRLETEGGTRYCLNVMNYGFEAEVCRTMVAVRRWPLAGGRMAYVTGIVHCLLTKRHNPCRITVDGEAWHSGDMLLGSAANGCYVGGGFRCAPHAVVDDGWLEAQCIDALSVPRFLKIIGLYRDGLHQDRADLHDVVHHRRVHSMVFESDREFCIVVDGELIRCRRVEVTCMPKALQFITPQQHQKSNA